MIDTSVLCVWLKVPGKETCGSSNALITYDIVAKKIELERTIGTTLVKKIGRASCRERV